jgi:hypothetical protein
MDDLIAFLSDAGFVRRFADAKGKKVFHYYEPSPFLLELAKKMTEFADRGDWDGHLYWMFRCTMTDKEMMATLRKGKNRALIRRERAAKKGARTRSLRDVVRKRK